MFGYIRPRQDELKVREDAYYRAAYCGLCRCLGKRYGLHARFLVNYDMTFLYLLLAGQEAQETCSPHFCPANPLKKKPCVPITPAMEYCADVCVILCALSLEDKRADSRGLKSLLPAGAEGLLHRAYKAACQRQGAFAQEAGRQLALLRRLEQDKCASMDQAADAFAALIACCAEGMQPENVRPARQLLYHVGRFIYLTDALDDLPKDVRAGSYNPLLYRFPCTDGELAKEDRAYVCRSICDSAAMAHSALALCSLKSNTEILENIVSLGMPAVLCAVGKGTFQAKHKMKDKGAL